MFEAYYASCWAISFRLLLSFNDQCYLSVLLNSTFKMDFGQISDGNQLESSDLSVLLCFAIDLQGPRRCIDRAASNLHS